jgi:hypothetical protein
VKVVEPAPILRQARQWQRAWFGWLASWLVGWLIG